MVKIGYFIRGNVMAFHSSLPTAFMMALTPTTSLAATPPPTCLTTAESNAMFVTVLPSLLKGVQERCSALPANSFLKSHGPALLQQYQAASAATSAVGSVALTKVMASELPKGMAPTSLMSFVSDMARATISEKLKSSDCGLVDHGIASIAPLPAANVAGLFTLIFEATDADKDSPIHICKAEGSS